MVSYRVSGKNLSSVTHIGPTCDFAQSLYIIISTSSMSSTTHGNKFLVAKAPFCLGFCPHWPALHINFWTAEDLEKQNEELQVHVTMHH